ncbi:MAG: aspartate aminotransferase family protein [Acidobacteria bacterium]|nr:aspartate aminotransferase family protein [Acidobacteriota bacterium]
MTTDRSQMTHLERERAAVLHAWTSSNNYHPLMVKDAHGVWVRDEDDVTYLDFSSQLVNTNIGHQHPAVVAAIQEQAAVLTTIGPQHGNIVRTRAAELILDHAFKGASKVFFTTGGAESIENAVRMARIHTGRHKLLAAYRSYHGGTATAVALTGEPRRWLVDNGSSGVVHFFGPFLYRSEFHSTTEAEECERALAHLESVVRFEGPSTIAALVLESVPGTAGIMVPPPGYLAGVREICDRYGIVYIADEVMSGFGRTGRWFAFQDHGVTPDLVTFAKGVNSGYVPLGGVILNEAIAATFDERYYPGGLTYSGHPLACAAAVATIESMEKEGVVENARRIGEEVLGPGLRDLASRHPVIGEVRGVGTFWALDLVTDRATKEPLAPYGGSSEAMGVLLSAVKAEHLLIFSNFHRLHVVPPCVITEEEAREGLARLDRALTSVAGYYTGAQ